MKKNLLKRTFVPALLLLLGVMQSFGQTSFTATYTFGANGNVSSFTYNGTVYDGIVPGNMEKVGITTSSSSGNFRGSNWPVDPTPVGDLDGTMDAGKYIGFTISPAAGYKFTVTSLTFGIGRSGTGTRQSQWRGSFDSYGSAINNYTSLNGGLTNTGGVLQNPDENSSWTGNVLTLGTDYADLTSEAGFRLYMYNAEGTGGTGGLQGAITISGTYEFAAGGTAASPTFNPPAGTYYLTQNVSLSSLTEDATIYYSDVSSTGPWTLYTAAIPVSSTKTLWAYAEKSGLSNSPVSSAAYTIVPVTEVANIDELRGQPVNDNTVFKLTGEVVMTFKQTFRNQKYIQDATAAILIDDQAAKITTVYNVGDGITGILGTLTEFGGMLQFTPVLDPGPATSTGNVMIPQEITLADYNANFEFYESELVKIIGVTFTNGGSNFANGAVYAITDASSKASANFRTTFFDVNYIGTMIPLFPVDLVAIPNSRAEGNFLTSRNLDDIIATTTTIVITAPNGGEIWDQGTGHDITWVASNFDGNVKIELTDGVNATELTNGIPAMAGSWTWNIPADQAVGSNYKIIVSDEDDGFPVDESDNTFAVVVPPPPPNIVITEISYNPPESGTDSLEYIELYNAGAADVNLQGWYFSLGVVYTFPAVSVSPGGYVVVANNSAAFLNTFGFTPLQWSSGSLGNNGEVIELKNANGDVMDVVEYDDVDPWPTLPDGFGPSLTLCDPSADNADGANWSFAKEFVKVNAAGSQIFGNPGAGCTTLDVQWIPILTGWGGLSSNVIPDNPAIPQVMNPVFSKLIVQVAMTGFYWPEQNINTLGNWQPTLGYKVKFSGPCYFPVYGTQIPLPSTVNLKMGVNYLPVHSQVPVMVTELFGADTTRIIALIDIATMNIYAPGLFNTLMFLEPGVGYLAFMAQTTDVVFPDAKNTSGNFAGIPARIPYQVENQTSWNDVVNTGSFHLITFENTVLQNLEPGDYIGVFGSSGQCSGLVQYSGQNIALPVFGNDPCTNVTDGMEDNDYMAFKVYRKSGEILDMNVIYDPATDHSGVFTTNGYSRILKTTWAANSIDSKANATVQVYPKPAADYLLISSENNISEIRMTNHFGQLVYTNQKVNQNGVKIDITTYPAGIYILEVTLTSGSVARQQVIVQ